MAQAIISDGLGIMHPCCGVAHCTEPLENVKRDCFCPGHQYRLDVCTIEGCEQDVSTGYLTCEDAAHWALKQKRQLCNKANFQL